MTFVLGGDLLCNLIVHFRPDIDRADKTRCALLVFAVHELLILGIGDRHRSNILVSRKTGEVLHIDFGLTFEQSKVRDFS